MVPLTELRLMICRLSVPLGITPALVFMDYSALCVQNSTLTGTEAAQCSVSTTELDPRPRLKENPDGLRCLRMGTHCPPECWTVSR